MYKRCQLIYLFYLLTESISSPMGILSHQRSDLSKSSLPTWKTYVVTIWKPCNPAPVIYCSASIVTRSTLITSSTRVDDINHPESGLGGYPVMVGPISNLTAFRTNIKTMRILTSKKLFWDCAIIIVSYQVQINN